MRTLLLSCVLLAGVIRADSVGVYAPAILPGVTLADNVWQKYYPAAFGSNTTARIQAFYDMMCERVDVMDPNYTTWDSYAGEPIDKTLVSYPGCPSPSARAAATNSVFPSVDQYRTLYTNMCSWLSRNPAVTPAASDAGSLYPYWQSPLCYDAGISVTTNGIVSRNTDVYPCALSRFGYVGSARHDISNALQTVANNLNLSYTVDTNGVTAADLDSTFCRFTDQYTGADRYVDALVPTNAADAHPLVWAPLYSFDRICNDMSSRNVSVIEMTGSDMSISMCRKVRTYTYSFDTAEISSALLTGLQYGGRTFYPTSVTVTDEDSSTYSLTTPWSSAKLTPFVTDAEGYINTIGGQTSISFKYGHSPSISIRVITESSTSDTVSLGRNVYCTNPGPVLAPEYLKSSRVTAVGKKTEVTSAPWCDGMVTASGTYYATRNVSDPCINDVIIACTSNAYTLTDADIYDLLAKMTNVIGGLHVYASGSEFYSSYTGDSAPSVARVYKTYTLPYLICENEYAFTGWSGHVAQPTDPLTVVGPQADYGDGDGGTDDFDVWVDATALASNADGSRERPFLTLDAAIEAVNPSGGAHAVTNRTPKIGIRKGTYEFPQYFRRTQGGDTPYAVRLIGIGPYVTIDKKKRGQSLGSDLSDSSRFSSLENLNFYVNYEGWGGRSFCAFVIVNCKFSGWYTGSCYAFIEGSYVLNSLFQDLTCYVREDDNVFIYGSEIEGCIFDGINATSDNRLVINMVSDISNSLILGGKWKEIGKNYRSYPHAFAHSTLYLPDVTTKTQPNATNCLFFIDGLTTTEDFRKHNVVTNTTLFATSIDPTTKTPTTDYSDWKKLGFKGDTRTE